MTHTSSLAIGPRVLIAVATYKRVDLLNELLASLNTLVFRNSPNAKVAIAVIDNDPQQSARICVEDWAQRCILPLRYHSESQPGVTHVRNKALALAENYDFLAFVDDDEYVTPHWLDTLIARQEAEQAAAVFGPVHPVYEDGAPDWIRNWAVHGRFMDSDGPQPKPGATCNCLIDMQVVRKEGLSFDPRMSLTGGEDTLFFSQLIERGYAMARAKDALVYEHVPANRATPRWVLTRWYRTGITDTIIFGRHTGKGLLRLKSFFGGVARMAVGGALTAFAAITSLGRNPVAMMKPMYTACRGAGMVVFAFGHKYEEYGRK